MTTIRLAATLIVALASLAAGATPLAERADSAYTADRFADAVELYSRAIAEEGPTATLYYNLGNAYYRLDQPGKAIVAYERALRIDPSMADARANLEFVNSRITDRPGERGSFLSRMADRTASLTAANSWAWIAFGLFMLTAGAVVLYMLGPTVMMRKAGFFGGILCLAAFLLTLLIALRAASIASDRDTAIVIAPSTILSTSPREPKDRSEEAMLLHEGTRINILDSIAAPADTTGLKWYDAAIDNTHRAWIRSTDVERI